ncbi:PPOX class F420-dependent oxidoreductase [Nocardioides sp. KC13]|uniref:PPOX class F420-dependent oxidoreductase n=1 Tax=Nocardioides turkmenicus TaxID=2711220 RepID=A0A6M1R7N5_9ACTN|nr:PPOX class F420-dependent oxidoreductase [Nocardioides sp. KC13]NGN95652.1 PPOX class F420-dependent oxidoreductase [Nocardioides sp. KC13]
MKFTETQLRYLRTQPLGRLATLAPDGGLQNNPVGFKIDDEHRIVIGGHQMGRSRKFRNAQKHNQVAFVVDDLESTNPWKPRMIEIRGTAEALTDVDPPMKGMSREILRITPTRIIEYGLHS